jgi:hypothetical protein
MVIQSSLVLVENQLEFLPHREFLYMVGNVFIKELDTTIHGKTGELVDSLRTKVVLLLVFIALVVLLPSRQTRYGDIRMV